MFKERVKKLRNELGLTQEEFSKIINLTRSSYSRYETGDREPDLETLKKIAKKLDVSSDYLLGLIDNPYPINHVIDSKYLENSTTVPLINKEKEPTPEIGSFEWLRQGLVSRGVMKDGEDITAEQLQIMLANIATIAKVFQQKVEK